MDLIKRFIIFYGDTYYPQGGWNDFAYVGVDSLEEAMKRLGNPPREWGHIVDLQKMSIVFEWKQS